MAQPSQAPNGGNAAPGVGNPRGILLLEEYEPIMIDGQGDQREGPGTHDLVAAWAVMDSEAIYARVLSAEPMTWDSAPDLRFWLERAPNGMTVEVKTRSPDGICELNHDVGGEPWSRQVMNCVQLKPASVDVIIPVEALPEFLQGPDRIHATTFETCCADEARDQPYDVIDDDGRSHQQIFRPGMTSDELVPG